MEFENIIDFKIDFSECIFIHVFWVFLYLNL